MTMPCVRHRSFRVHVRGGDRLWTTMSHDACESMLCKWGCSLRWTDGKVHRRCPTDVVEVVLDVVRLRFVYTIHIFFLTGLNACLPPICLSSGRPQQRSWLWRA